MLKFKELFIISEILDCMKIDQEIENINKKLYETKKDMEDKNFNVNEIKKYRKEQMEVNLLTLICSKIHLAEDPVTRLIMKSENMSVEDVEDLGVTEIWDIIEKLISEGLPEVLQNRFQDLKKTL